MIAAIPGGVLIALLCLLAFAPLASAGSGWVLWTQEVATEPGLVTGESLASHSGVRQQRDLFLGCLHQGGGTGVRE